MIGGSALSVRTSSMTLRVCVRSRMLLTCVRTVVILTSCCSRDLARGHAVGQCTEHAGLGRREAARSRIELQREIPAAPAWAEDHERRAASGLRGVSRSAAGSRATRARRRCRRAPATNGRAAHPTARAATRRTARDAPSREPVARRCSTASPRSHSRRATAFAYINGRLAHPRSSSRSPSGRERRAAAPPGRRAARCGARRSSRCALRGEPGHDLQNAGLRANSVLRRPREAVVSIGDSPTAGNCSATKDTVPPEGVFRSLGWRLKLHPVPFSRKCLPPGSLTRPQVQGSLSSRRKQ